MAGPDRVRVGLVGAGSIAQVAELPALAARNDVAVVGLVTRSPERAAYNLSRWPIEKAYPTVDEMVAQGNLDALFVLTPKHDHTRFVMAGLEAGLDVFCEKPLASSIDEAASMAQLAERYERVLMVGFNRRYADVYVRAREVFTESAPQFVVAQKNRAGTEYRATLENAIHMVDLLRWFCGEAVTVHAEAIATDPYHEEGLSALMTFDSGARGVLVAARCAGEWDERLEAYGNGSTVRVVAPDSVSITCGGTTQLIETRPRALGWAQATETMGFAAEVDHFLECVTTRRQPRTSGQDAVRTQRLVEKIIRVAGLPSDDLTSADAVPRDHEEALR